MDFNKSVIKLREFYERLERAKRRAILIDPLPMTRRMRYDRKQIKTVAKK